MLVLPMLLLLLLLARVCTCSIVYNTPTSAVNFHSARPDLFYLVRDNKGAIHRNVFEVNFRTLVELDPDGVPVFGLDLQQTPFNVVEPVQGLVRDTYYEIVFEIPDAGAIQFQVYNQSDQTDFGGQSLDVPQGSVEFALTLLGWPFSSPLNTLQLNASIYVHEPSLACDISLAGTDETQSSYAIIACDTDAISAQVSLFTFALSGPLGQLPTKDSAQLVDVSVVLDRAPYDPAIDGTNGVLDPSVAVTYDSDLCDDDDESDEPFVYEQYKRDNDGSSAMYMISVNFDAFSGSLLYDPDFSVLLNNKGGGGDDCDDTFKYWDVNDPFLWLSLGMVILAVVSIVVVSLVIRCPGIHNYMIGAEGSRVKSTRKHLRRQSISMSSGSVSEHALYKDEEEERTKRADALMRMESGRALQKGLVHE